MERDSFHVKICVYSDYFNSHAHVERDVVTISSALKNGNFNSHAHVERDIIECALKFYNDISTHTLTWSVTFYLYNTNTEEKFQLTRSRGA